MDFILPLISHPVFTETPSSSSNSPIRGLVDSDLATLGFGETTFGDFLGIVDSLYNYYKTTAMIHPIALQSIFCFAYRDLECCDGISTLASLLLLGGLLGSLVAGFLFLFSVDLCTVKTLNSSLYKVLELSLFIQ